MMIDNSQVNAREISRWCHTLSLGADVCAGRPGRKIGSSAVTNGKSTYLSRAYIFQNQVLLLVLEIMRNSM